MLTINGLGGDDTIDASKLAANQLHLQVNAGDGNDPRHRQRRRRLHQRRPRQRHDPGGRRQRTGWCGIPATAATRSTARPASTRCSSTAANINEIFDLSANGTHDSLFRNVANITMDLVNVERIELQMFGGSDQITIGDLTGTAVKQVALDLGTDGAGGNEGDEVTDTVILNAGKGNNHLEVTQLGNLDVRHRRPLGGHHDQPRRIDRQPFHQWSRRQ